MRTYNKIEKPSNRILALGSEQNKKWSREIWQENERGGSNVRQNEEKCRSSVDFRIASAVFKTHSS